MSDDENSRKRSRVWPGMPTGRSEFIANLFPLLPAVLVIVALILVCFRGLLK
jgi:hypothetical protein